MSGTAISSFAVDKEPDETAKEVSAVDSCHTITDSLGFVRCMQKLPVDTIIKGDDKVQVSSKNTIYFVITRLFQPEIVVSLFR